MVTTFISLVLIGYFIGSIPSSYISMRFFTGKDIRKLGTGNATVTAVLMYGGKRPAIIAALAA
jgi:glycerol-3-phosphate acyltransferase PlsY